MDNRNNPESLREAIDLLEDSKQACFMFFEGINVLQVYTVIPELPINLLSNVRVRGVG